MVDAPRGTQEDKNNHSRKMTGWPNEDGGEMKWDHFLEWKEKGNGL